MYAAADCTEETRCSWGVCGLSADVLQKAPSHREKNEEVHKGNLCIVSAVADRRKFSIARERARGKTTAWPQRPHLCITMLRISQIANIRASKEAATSAEVSVNTWPGKFSPQKCGPQSDGRPSRTSRNSWNFFLNLQRCRAPVTNLELKPVLKLHVTPWCKPVEELPPGERQAL